MSEFTSRERVVLAYDKQYADRVPTDIQGLMVAVQRLGFSGRELGTDAQKLAKTLIESWEMNSIASLLLLAMVASDREPTTGTSQ